MQSVTQYTHRGVSLGQKVRYKGKEYIIIGLDVRKNQGVFVVINNPYSDFRLNKSLCTNTLVVLKGYENSYYEWVSPSEIEIIPSPSLTITIDSEKVVEMVKEKIEDITMNGLNSIPDSNLITHLESKGYTVTKPLTLEEILNQLREEIKDKGRIKSENYDCELNHRSNHGDLQISQNIPRYFDNLSSNYLTVSDAHDLMVKYNKLLKDNGHRRSECNQ